MVAPRDPREVQIDELREQNVVAVLECIRQCKTLRRIATLGPMPGDEEFVQLVCCYMLSMVTEIGLRAQVQAQGGGGA